MSPLLVATLLGHINPETGSLGDSLAAYRDKAVGWLLPTVQPLAAMPIVPDGSVQGQHYVPPNTTVDVVGNAQSLALSAKRLTFVAGGAGIVVGGLVVWLLKRK